MVTHEFPPVFDSSSQVLILGSFPSVKSRKVGFYYMHPQNRFWQILEILFNEKIVDKKTFCLKHHLALWDTIGKCTISSSSDSSIKDVVPNDLNVILSKANIKQIFTTGKKAHQIYEKYLYPQTKMKDICLPSSSPANATYSLSRLVEEYKIILTFLS